jgi:triphosphoribosyl-dephospho-CoA synthase
VSTVDNGSHADMNAPTFIRSLFTLRHYFAVIADAGSRDAPFTLLQAHGVAAEQRMLRATGGVNTHRGAIFTLGLLAAAAGQRHAHIHPLNGAALGQAVRTLWGQSILEGLSPARCNTGMSHGRMAALRYGALGARAQAAQGFPALFDTALPVLSQSLRHGCDLNRAMVQTLFTLMTTLVDTNLLYRGGPQALAFAQQAASGFLKKGGVHRRDWRRRAIEIHHDFVQRRLSPGGSADLLSAALFVFLLQQEAEAH